MTSRDLLPSLPLIRDLCAFATGAVAPDNEAFFERISAELPLVMHRYKSGDTFNGWVVPHNWRIEHAKVFKDGRELFDGALHPLGVAMYSKSFHGECDFEELSRHVSTNAKLPSAYMFHCMWQYRPWAADWSLSIPYETFRTFGAGRYRVELQTQYEPGEMVVVESVHRGRSDRTIVFNAHTCHPGQANDDNASVALLVRLFQWLSGQDTHYTYKLLLGPEHLGTVFYLRGRDDDELQRMVSGIFAEMPGTDGALTIASTFLGHQPIDKACAHAARHYTKADRLVPWRQGAGNDETIWEAPGYEVPFVEISRALDFTAPFPEYHSSLDTPDLLQESQLDEFLLLLRRVVEILEQNAVLHRRFTGLVCLSNPQFDLYFERPDPSVVKNLDPDGERWGYLLDSMFRYFDGSISILDIAIRHDLPFDRLYRYFRRMEEKGLIRMEFLPIARVPISRTSPSASA